MLLLNRPSARRRRPSARLILESLESRDLMTASWADLTLPVVEHESNDTLDLALDLGDISGGQRGEAVGTIGNNAYLGADVDWYQFSLSQAGSVNLNVLSKPGGHFAPVLSLYNNDPFDFGDPYDPDGHLLLAQSVAAAGGTAVVNQDLAAGTYFVAVSGAGNTSFHPLVADSGFAGSTGDYGLLLQSTDLNIPAVNGPQVLSTTPGAGAQLTDSPLILRVDLDEPIDPSTVIQGQTVRLITNPTGTFGDGNDQDVALASVNVSSTGDELQLVLQNALAPGYYRIDLAGDSTSGMPVIADLNGTPLNATAGNPTGADFTRDFSVIGVEGTIGINPTPNDSVAGATNLGDVTNSGLVQVKGTIGDDPTLANPGSDVDLYHIHISGPGLYLFQTEVFAGRIGSPLDAGVSIFYLDPSDGLLHFVTGNDNTQNTTLATDGMTTPLYTDPAFAVGLTAGDYYIAVSSGTNVPDPSLAGQLPGQNGVFDPNNPHQATNGFSTGDYILNFVVTPAPTAPHVVAASIQSGAVLNGPPVEFTVQFDKDVNLQQLSYTAFALNANGAIAPVFFTDGQGNTYYPRLESYDSSTFTATFFMYDALPNGSYEFHLSGAQGLTNLAGVPLVGNDASGDYVIHFQVAGPTRGINGNPLTWQSTEPNDSLQSPQVIGDLFPHELTAVVNGKTGVAITRDYTQDPTNAPADTGDDYQFTVLKDATFSFSLSSTAGLPAHTLPIIYDAQGNVMFAQQQGGGASMLIELGPGTYTVAIGGWSAVNAANVKYTLRIATPGSQENPTSLTAGPAPAIRFQFVSNPDPAPPAPTPTPAPAPNNPPAAGPSTPETPAPEAPVPDAPNFVFTPSPSFTAPPSVTFNITAPLTLPAGATSALSAGPIGGVTGNGDLFARNFLRVPDASGEATVQFVGQLAALPILAPLSEGPGDTAEGPQASTRPEAVAGTPAPRRSSHAVQVLRESWDQALALIGQAGTWLAELPAPLPATETQVATTAESDRLGSAEIPAGTTTPGAGSSGFRTMAVGAVIAGGFVLLSPWTRALAAPPSSRSIDLRRRPDDVEGSGR